MKRIILYILLLLITIFEASSQQTKSDVTLINKDGKYMIEYNGRQFKANENILTVKYKDSLHIKSNLKILRENKLGLIDIKVPEKKNIEEFAKELKESGLFEIVEFNAYGEYNAFTPNDSLISNQWYLSNIKMFDTWDLIMGGSCIVIGILDSGTDWEHEDIGIGSDSYQNIFLNPGEDAWTDVNDPSTGNGIDDDGNGLIDDWKGWNYANNTNDSRPVFYHGTFVSGIASAKTNNVRGIAGVSGGNNSSGIRLLPYCIGLSSPDGSVVDDAIIDAVDIGVKVINLSISIPSSVAINTAIEYAINNNVVIVASSGNDDSSSVSYPASNSNVIAVGATTTSNTRASFSNYGTELDIVAPGVDIYSTTPNDNYDIESGTSFAAPQVSAAAALIFSIDNTFTTQEVRNIIESTAQKVGGYSYITTLGHPNGTWNSKMGYGILDVYSAVLTASGGNISGPRVVCNSNTTFSLAGASGLIIDWDCDTSVLTEVGDDDESSYVVRANSSSTSGEGWIRVKVITACGDTITQQKTVWAGKPQIYAYGNHIVDVNTGMPVYDFCYGTSNDVEAIHPAGDAGITDWDWQVSYGQVYPYGMLDQYATIYPNDYQSFMLEIRACNTCGYSNWAHMYTNVVNCGRFLLIFTPNPTTGETTLSIESESEEKEFDDTAEWEMEIYSESQLLKEKKTSLRGKSTKIQTQGWKEGVYMVRVNYRDKILTGKLVVKK